MNKCVNAVALVCGHLVEVVRGFGFIDQLIKLINLKKRMRRGKRANTQARTITRARIQEKIMTRASPKRRAKGKTLSSPRILL